MVCFDLCLVISVIGLNDSWQLLTRGIKGDDSSEMKIFKNDLPLDVHMLIAAKKCDGIEDYLSQVVGNIIVIKFDFFGAIPKVDRFASQTQTDNFMRVMLANIANKIQK